MLFVRFAPIWISACAIKSGDMNAKAFATPPKFLSGLTATQRKHILQLAEVREFRANSIIINAGDPANTLFLLKTGSIKYYRLTKKGDEVLLWWATPGDIFGIGTLLGTPTAYVGTAEAIDDCELLVWSRKTMRRLAKNFEVLAENTLQIVMTYLAAHADRLVGLAAETAEERLAHTLLQLGSRTGRATPKGVELAMTNEHLGGMANVSPFTASRQLKEWERQGIIQKRRGKIIILSPEELVID
jgi:CRP-like cAMP-binding protein